jgi:large subunit ribosomal protein L10
VNREDKEKQVKELSEAFNSYDSFYLVDFLNMSASKAVELRKLFRDNDYTFRVVKNRLAMRALREDFPQGLKESFQGLTAIAFAPQDPIGLARLINDFSSRNKILSVKAGILEGEFLSADRFKEVANLVSREELLARFGSLMAAPLMRLLRTWHAPLSGIGTLLSQLKTKK